MTIHNFHGDHVSQRGDYNIGIIKSQTTIDQQAALSELLNALSGLRAHVSVADQEIIDESAEIIQQADKRALRRRLGNLIGIATMAGAVGSPVIDAALKVKQLFGL